jgi:hypothetical protein
MSPLTALNKGMNTVFTALYTQFTHKEVGLTHITRFPCL